MSGPRETEDRCQLRCLLAKQTMPWPSGSLSTAAGTWEGPCRHPAPLSSPHTIPTLNFSTARASQPQLLIPIEPASWAICSCGSWSSPLFSSLPLLVSTLLSPWPIHSAGDVKFATFSSYSGLFLMPLAVLSLMSTVRSFPSTTAWSGHKALTTKRCSLLVCLPETGQDGTHWFKSSQA